MWLNPLNPNLIHELIPIWVFWSDLILKTMHMILVKCPLADNVMREIIIISRFSYFIFER